MGCPLPPSGSGLRKTRLNSWSFPLPHPRLPHARKLVQVTHLKLITGSSKVYYYYFDQHPQAPAETPGPIWVLRTDVRLPTSSVI